MDVLQHYVNLLAPIYTWMLGNWTERLRDEQKLLEALLTDATRGRAVDLGCGSGLQSLPLAALGYDVLAVDFCFELLDELRSRSGGWGGITTLAEDIMELRSFCRQPVQLICCMGDTLLHLPTEASARNLIRDAATCLLPGGHLLLGFRDFSEEVTEQDRFIPIRSDNLRILTSFLEYKADRVWVYDLLHTKVADQSWRLQASCYHKLRLSVDGVEEWIRESGLQLRDKQIQKNMILLKAQLPDRK